MAAKLLLVMVALLACIVSIDPHGIKTNTVDVGCDGHDCVETIRDRRDSDAVVNDITKKSITCEDAGGKCVPKKKQEKCKKSINEKYKCSKKTVCCIKKPTDEVVNQCLKNGTDNSVILQTLNNVDHDINSNLNDTNKSIKSCIHNAKDDIEIKLQSMTQLQETTISKLDEMEIKIEHKQDEMETKMQAKLDYIIKHLEMTFTSRCNHANGFLTLSHDECFIFNKESRSWDAAVTYCSSQGLRMASPRDGNAIWLRKHIIDNYGEGWTHLSGRGDGSAIVMNGEAIPESNTLWYPGHPGSSVTTSHCLILMTTSRNMNQQPDTPYLSSGCSNAERTLCELV